VSDLYDPREQWASYLINAIKAKELQQRDVNYIVKQVAGRPPTPQAVPPEGSGHSIRSSQLFWCGNAT